MSIHQAPDALVHPAVVDLIEAHPLAWVTSHAGQTSVATPLPLVGDYEDDGRLTGLIGHFALSNRQVAALREEPRALILFSGPQAYVSPKHVINRTWAPTWVYSVARFECRIDFNPDANDTALRRLTAKMEAMHGDGWTVDEVGSPRYDQMKAHIIAFRAEILGCDANFKLGQDERDENFATIVAGLDDEPLVTWMKRARG
ncbi:MAG: FMN-binding negative transcriptional regulator [Beijerinckiaceae bacterium]|nr:FMN-binding negative transcriptional regulator [Beijerinckiaceae bacterium]